MNKFKEALRRIFAEEPNTFAAVAIVITAILLILAMVAVIAAILNVLPHTVLMALIATTAVPTAIYYLKKNWPKE